MKTLFPFLLIAGAIQASPTLAQTPAEPASAPSPLLGTWVLDVASMPFPPEARPKSVTITYSDVGGGNWRTNVDIVGRDGHEIRAAGTYALDGTAAPSEGYPAIDTVATALPAPNVMVSAFYKEGMPRTTRTYTVAADGRTMTETVVWLNLNGKPEITTSRFNRVE